MLYKVTPMLPGPEAKPKRAREPGQPRKKRKSAIYDHEGNEVLITLMCLKCRSIKPLAQFGLRKMADGAIRNQPWCRGCRSGAGTPKAKVPAEQVAAVAAADETVSASEHPAELEVRPAADASEQVSTTAAPADPAQAAAPEVSTALPPAPTASDEPLLIAADGNAEASPASSGGAALDTSAGGEAQPPAV